MRRLYGLLECLVFFSLGATMVLPAFDRRIVVSGDGYLPFSGLVDQGVFHDTWLKPDGSYISAIGSSPVNWNNGTSWRKINTTIVTLPSDHLAYQYGYRAGVDEGLFSVYFKPRSGSPYPVAFVYDRNESDNQSAYLRTKLLYAGYLASDEAYNWNGLFTVNDVLGTVDGSTATFENVFTTGVDARWTYESDQLKEEIVCPQTTKAALQNNPPSAYGLNNSRAWFGFITQLDFGSLSMYNGTVEINGNYTLNEGRLLFKDSLGTIKVVMPLDNVYESNGLGIFPLHYKIIHYQGNYYLLTGLKYTDLITMTFPVIFDPTTSYTENGNNGMVRTYSKPAFSTARELNPGEVTDNTQLFAGAGEGYYVQRAMAFYDTSSLPDTCTITSASMNYTTTLSRNNPTIQFWFDTDNTYPGTSLGTSDFYYGYYEQRIANQSITGTGEYNTSFSTTSFISKTGTTSFCIREKGHDVDNVDPLAMSYQWTVAREDVAKLWVTYTEWSNTAPTFSSPLPANSSVNVRLTPATNITITDPNTNQTLTVDFYENHTVPGSWTHVQHNTSAGSSPVTLRDMAASYASDGSTKYWWKVTCNDGLTNQSAIYHFTTVGRANVQVFDRWLLCGNESTRVNERVGDWWLTCANASTRISEQVFNVWLLCSNTSTRASEQVGNWWLLCSNETSRVNTQIVNLWLLCSNESSRGNTQIVDLWLFCSNESSRTNAQVFDRWLLCSNESTRANEQVADVWLLCGNATERVSTQVVFVWLRCSNESTRANTQISNLWLHCGNESSRSSAQIENLWLLCGNASTRASEQVFNVYLVCGNGTSRAPAQVGDWWLLCANGSARTSSQVESLWLLCGNASSRANEQIDNLWLQCDNTSSRASEQVGDWWLLCSNGSSRVSSQIVNVWLRCSNASQTIPTQVFDRWLLCGNESFRANEQIGDWWLQCANESSRGNNQIINLWLLCGNTSTRANEQIGDWWLRCSNTSETAPTKVADVWLLCGNSSSRGSDQVENLWILCGNASTRANYQIVNVWLACGNTSARASDQVMNVWLLCSNASETAATQVCDVWLQCANGSSRTNTRLTDLWLLCGNASTRSGTQMVNVWLLCGNASSRSSEQAGDWWLRCGNGTTRLQTKVGDWWLLCGNDTTRVSTQIVNVWLLCSNESSRTNEQIFNVWMYCANEDVPPLPTHEPWQVANVWLLCSNITDRTSTQICNVWLNCSNTSEHRVVVTVIYPANGTYDVTRNVTLQIFVRHLDGDLMHIYFQQDNGSVALVDYEDAANGTYAAVSQSPDYYTLYNWSYNVTDGVEWVNGSQWFRTEASGGIIMAPSRNNGMIYALIGALGGLMFAVLFAARRRKRGKGE